MNGDDISQLLTDEYAAKILMAAYKHEVNAISLSRDFEIPIAACYRRLRALESAGLIEMTTQKHGAHGKKIKNYRSLVKSATISFAQGRMMACLHYVDGEEKTLLLNAAAAP